MKWISLGGGIHFTGEDYPLDKLAERLKRFAGENGVQVYLEPGEAAITKAATLRSDGAGHALQRQESGHCGQLDRGAYAGSADLPPSAPRWPRTQAPKNG
jgi:hypothetical protein